MSPAGPAIPAQSVLNDDFDDPAMMFAPLPPPTTDAAVDEPAPPPRLLPFNQMEPNPENARHPEHKVDERVADLKSRGQLQNINVMTRDRFLAVKPHLEDRLKGAPYVVVNGCLRFTAGPRAGLAGLKYDVRDDWDADDIDEAMVAENVHRDDINPMLLARQLGRMLERPKYGGSARALGEALNKKHPWVPERLNLNKLHPDLQDAIEAERIKFNLARQCVRLHADLQPKLASGELPENVAKAWLITLKIKPDEQLRRWKAGEPFDVEPVIEKHEEVAEETPKEPKAKPFFSVRLMDRSPEALRAFAVKLRDELTDAEREAIVEELTAAG